MIGLIAIMAVAYFVAPKAKKFAEEMQRNPTRMMANTMVAVSAGQLEMVAEDDANKRYTLREKQSRKLTTVYWNAKINGPGVIDGDFSAIPAEAGLPPPPVVVPEPK